MNLRNVFIICVIAMSLQGCAKSQTAPELSNETITQMNTQNPNDPMQNSSYMYRSPSPAVAGAIAGARGGR